MLRESLQRQSAQGCIETVGAERQPVLVIENFLPHPEPLVREAQKGLYGEPSGKGFPGARAPAPATYANALLEALLPRLGPIFGLNGWKVAKVTSDFSLITQAPTTLTLRQRIPHVDANDPGLIALLHYLTPGDCFGTSFYRHRATDFERITQERHESYWAILNRELQVLTPHGYISGDTPIFERTHSFDGLFNRLIVYQGHTLHSADVPADFGFQSDPRHGRLSANTFLYMLPPR